MTRDGECRQAHHLAGADRVACVINCNARVAHEVCNTIYNDVLGTSYVARLGNGLSSARASERLRAGIEPAGAHIGIVVRVGDR